jgi:hypothetical protein
VAQAGAAAPRGRVIKTARTSRVLAFFVTLVALCSKALVFVDGRCEAQGVIEEACPRKGRIKSEFLVPVSFAEATTSLSIHPQGLSAAVAAYQRQAGPGLVKSWA